MYDTVKMICIAADILLIMRETKVRFLRRELTKINFIK